MLWANMIRYSHAQDVVAGLSKALIFGGITALVSCYKGMNCGAGRGRRRPRHHRGGRLFFHFHPDQPISFSRLFLTRLLT